MKKTITALMVAFTLLVTGGGVVYAQDYEKGRKAYQKGDYATALREWSVLAEQGDANAQVNLGGMYDMGRGVTQDYKEAVKWYRKAAEQGDMIAQVSLGLNYRDGWGVTQDYKEAVKWYRKAAEQGFFLAQGNLGAMYATGRGVIQDNVYAHMWFNIAASTGDDVATKKRDRIAKQMTPSQIAEVQKLARECVKKQFKGC